MRIYRAKDYYDMSRKAANIISAQVIMKPDCVLGLATGSTPVGTYAQLVEWYKKGDLDFSEVKTVNLDEYKGEGPKMGKVKFILQPEGTQLSIDGKAADVSQPVELKYGTHKLTVTSEKYGTLTRKLVVGSAESEITINMGTEAKKDKEAEEKKSSTTTNSSSTGTNSSTTNSLNNKKSSSSANSSTGISTKKSTSENSGSTTKKSTGTAGTSSTSTDNNRLKQISDFISTILD